MNNKLGVSESYLNPYGVLGNLALCKSCGFDCVELKNLDDNQGTKKLLLALSDENIEAGIHFRSIHLPFGEEYDISHEDELVRNSTVWAYINIIRSAAILRPEIVVLHASFEPVPDARRKQRMANCIDSLRLLCPRAREYGAKVAVECLPRSCLGNTSADLLFMISEVKDQLGICFDSNHLTKESNSDFIKNTGRHIVTTHFSDFDGVDEKHWLPGKGVLNWPQIISMLKHHGYNGPYIFETRSEDLPLTEALDLLKKSWREISE